MVAVMYGNNKLFNLDTDFSLSTSILTHYEEQAPAVPNVHEWRKTFYNTPELSEITQDKVKCGQVVKLAAS